MEEKIIIKSEHYSLSKIKSYLYGIPTGCILFGILMYLLNVGGSRGPNYWGEYWTILDNMLDPFSFIPGLFIDLGIIILIASVVIGAWLKSYKLTVTDKRVYGNTSWGKQVDLPIDSISAVASSSLKGIAVATSSGRIVFNLIKNRDEVHSAISKLIIDRQSKAKPSVQTTIKQEIPQSNADELKKYKDLLDSGVISQEEFDAKKKQLLGL